LLWAPDGQTQRRGQSGKDSNGPSWFHGKLADAQAQAKERNVPLVICCVLDGEEASDRFQASLKSDGNLDALDQIAILIIANNGDHDREEIEVRGDDGKLIEKSVCSAFGTDDCDAHKQHWDAVYKEYVMPDGGEWILPEALVVRPDGKLHGRYGDSDVPSTSTIVRSVELVQKELGRGVLASDLKRLREEVTMAQTMARAKLWAESWQSWTLAQGWAPTGPHADSAKAGLSEALKGMRSELEKQSKRLVDATLEDAYRNLRALGFDDSPIEKEVGKILSKARRNAAFKSRLAEVDLELESEALLDEIVAALKADDKKQAKRLLRKLLSKKLAQTPAARAASERYKDL